VIVKLPEAFSVGDWATFKEADAHTTIAAIRRVANILEMTSFVKSEDICDEDIFVICLNLCGLFIWAEEC
jgi:hypothetical protein